MFIYNKEDTNPESVQAFALQWQNPLKGDYYMKDTIQSVIEEFRQDRGRLLDMLLAIQDAYRYIPDEAVTLTCRPAWPIQGRC